MKDIIFISLAALIAILATGATYILLDARRSNLRHLKLVMGNGKSIETFMRFILKQMLHDKSFMLELGISDQQMEELQKSGFVLLPFDADRTSSSLIEGVKLLIEPAENYDFILKNNKGAYQVEGFFKVISAKESSDGWMNIKIWYFGTTSIINI